MNGRPAGGSVGQALAELWRRHRAENLDRIGTLEHVAATLLRGELTDDLRSHGARTAHKLAGSLGTFGFESGSRAALEAESLLGAAVIDPRLLAEAVVALRASVHDIVPEVAPSAPSKTDPPAPIGPTDELRLVIASADGDMIDRLAVDATTAGWSVDVVPDLVAARRILAAVHVDALVADLGPGELEPRHDGVLSDVARRTPTFVLSTESAQETRLAVSRSGVVGLVPRGQPAHQIVAFVRHTLARATRETTAVLALDRDPAVLVRIDGLLSPLVFRLVTLSDPRLYWSVLERVRPDVSLISVDLGEVDGLELCRTIRSDPYWHSLPLILVVDGADEAALDAGYRAGADDVVVRSHVGLALPARLTAHVRRSRSVRVEVDLDALTGCDSHPRAERSIGRLLRLAERQAAPVAVARVEPDRLASLATSEGRVASELVLHHIGARLRRSFRGEDVVGRWDEGGFVIGMYGADRQEGATRLAAVLDPLRSEQVRGTSGELVPLDCSAGVAARPADGTSLASLLSASENALSRARRAGARVLTSAPIDPSRQGSLGDGGSVDVVVVEDDDSVADVIEHAMRLRGLSLRRISDGVEAAALLCAGAARPRLVLLDVGLPGLDGFGVLERLREAGVLDHTAVIMLTARSSETETLRALDLGATDHVTKPFSIPVLLSRVEIVLGRVVR
jgi:diguanylate cyclase (GGDEF)-like protein